MPSTNANEKSTGRRTAPRLPLEFDRPRPDATELRTATFGPFSLRTTERILERDGLPLKIGSRTLDVLVALVENATKVVSKRDLIARVWGSSPVDEGSLRFQVAALRKILCDRESDARYVRNVQGRGYCFAGSVVWTTRPSILGEIPVAPAFATPLPRRPRCIVGRDGTVRDLTDQLREQRFVSVVGPGGIGKTTVALAVAYQVFSEFAGAVQFLDLAAIDDPQLIAPALASQLGLSVVSENPLPVILAFLRERRLLLVLDSCECLIEKVATLAETIFRDAPEVYILATSRESLRAEGEWVHHLSPLAYPSPDMDALTATQALGFPAVQLFVEHVTATGCSFRLKDADAPIVADLCRRLDGIPLALELAASRVGVYGVEGIVALFDTQFSLLRGRRTATPRHQTLAATLDWSHSLLSDLERSILRRLAILVGAFSLEAAVAVAAEDLDVAQVTETLATLVEKSLVSVDTAETTRYRLLDTTRAYARQKLAESGEHMKLARRQCEYVTSSLERFKVTALLAVNLEAVTFFRVCLGNVHAALEWAFSEFGDTTLGMRLAAVSAPLFFKVSLLAECTAWTERALRHLNPLNSGTRIEFELQACFGLVAMYTKGDVPAVQSALVRAWELAESSNDGPGQLLVLHGLYRWDCRTGDFRRLRDFAMRIEAAAKQCVDPLGDSISRAYWAVTCCLTGDYCEAVRHARIALSYPVHRTALDPVLFGSLHRVSARNTMARSLWMLGYADQALAAAEEARREADDVGYPPTIAYNLAWSLFVYLRTGAWPTAELLIERLKNHVTKHFLLTFSPAASGWEGSLAILRGDLSRGIQLLQQSLTGLRNARYELHSGVFSAALAEGLMRAGNDELALATVCAAVAWAETHARSDDLPELLRIKGEILAGMSPDNPGEAEACLLHSLQLAHEQSALALELRAGISLARQWADQGLFDKALELLAPLYGRFSEGFQTPDLLTAAKLLVDIRSRS